MLSTMAPELGDVTMSVHIVYFILHLPRHSMIELQKIHFLALVRAFFVIVKTDGSFAALSLNEEEDEV